MRCKSLIDGVRRLLMPRLHWVQVEVTSFCNASCIYCPRTVYKDRWQNRHLPMSTFHKLISDLPKTDLLFLQGWGEPLMNPCFFEMVETAKSRGLKVGATINGTLINEDNASRLVDSGMDILAFSMAGTGKLNDRFREGASVNSVLEAIRLVNKKKEQRGSHYPEIHIAYLLLRSGLEEIEALPEMLAGLGVKEVVVSPLDFVPSSVLKEETIIPRTDSEYNYVSGKLKETAVECRRLNMNFEYYHCCPVNHRIISVGWKPAACFFCVHSSQRPTTRASARISSLSKSVTFWRAVNQFDSAL